MAHMALAPVSEQTSYFQQYYRGVKDALMYNMKRRNPLDTSPALTQEEMESLADRSARLMLISKLYKELDKLANRVMTYSPEVDQENAELYIKAQGAGQ